jgi:hypothetical protein
MSERHYNDDEVAAIFRAAAEGAESRALPGGRADGLTLRDLQAIGSEVGISPTAVSLAAQSLDRPSGPAHTFLGFPVGVGRTVALDRPLTDREWELLVVELREVFRARGVVRTEGSLREWRNGNLHALIEPTPTGYRLRLGTYKSDARMSVAVGGLMVGLSALMTVAMATEGLLANAALGIFAFASIGAAFVANGTLRLPAWARLRQEQIDGIVERLAARTQDGRDSQALSSGPPAADPER